MSVSKALLTLALAAFVLYDIALMVYMAYLTICHKRPRDNHAISPG